MLITELEGLVAGIFSLGKQTELPKLLSLLIARTWGTLRMLNGGSDRTVLLRTKSCSWLIVSRSYLSMKFMKHLLMLSNSRIGIEKTQRRCLQCFLTDGSYAMLSMSMNAHGIAGLKASISKQKDWSLRKRIGLMNYLDMMFRTKKFQLSINPENSPYRSVSRMVGFPLQDVRVNGLKATYR